ncbi:MAG: LytTR family DNA-binding domain-containing protein [bacterium]
MTSMRPAITAVTRRRVLIADDEPLARERIRMMLEARGDYDIVAESVDGSATVEAIMTHAPEIVFLDIKMPGLDGLEVIAAVEDCRIPPAIVFVTAFDSYALQAFDVGAVDYLLKPFDAPRFEQAVARAEVRLAHRGRPDADDASRSILTSLQAEHVYPERFLVRGPTHLYFVRTQDVEWVDAQGNYVRLHVAGRAHFVRHTMKAFAEKLPPDRFIRVHRSVIVHVDQILKLEPHAHGEYVITLRDGTRVTSSRTYGDRLHALLR